MNYFNDVKAFHEKFDLPRSGPPQLLADDVLRFRLAFLHEELHEFTEAHLRGDLAECLDALLDLTYVCLGTAIFMGFGDAVPRQPDDAWPPRTIFDEAWRRVQAANMAKVRGANDGSDSKRRSPYDVVKPPGWVAPNHVDLVSSPLLDVTCDRCSVAFQASAVVSPMLCAACAELRLRLQRTPSDVKVVESCDAGETDIRKVNE